jgi:hypothetical protein
MAAFVRIGLAEMAMTFVRRSLALLAAVEELDDEGWLMDDKVRDAAYDLREVVDDGGW